ncbi:MAG: hypothetical protein ACR2NM_16225 [Bythopirellula sp.]
MDKGKLLSTKRIDCIADSSTVWRPWRQPDRRWRWSTAPRRVGADFGPTWSRAVENLLATGPRQLLGQSPKGLSASSLE